MFSTTFSVIVAVSFISFVSGLVSNRKVANKAAFKCAGSEMHEVVSVEQSNKAPKSDDEAMELACKSIKEFVQCIENTDPADYTSHAPDMLHLMLAYQWQFMVITKRAGLCKDIQTEQLNKIKKITKATGIMKKENLPNVEKDSYKKCVGDAVRKCTVRNELLVKKGIDSDLLTWSIDYVACIEETGYDCHAAMLDHFLAFMKAFQRILKRNNGKFGKMAENIESN